MTSQGHSGATLYMLNHGFSTAALFLVAGWMISRRGSSTIAEFGGLQRVTHHGLELLHSRHVITSSTWIV